MIGKTIAHYRIIEEIGRGGMGVVYKAEDTKLKRTVALKFLSPELTRNPEAKERFLREAQAAAALSHPNICTVHEIEDHKDSAFIVMEYIAGQSLKDKLADGPLKILEVLDIAAQLAEGLQAAHNHDIIHRDIKPANIMLTSEGTVKILDFGLAKLAGHAQLTKDNSTLGTVAYMSPEQVGGKEVDWHTDIWSLGVVLYEMITGQLPFRGEYEQAVVYAILNEKPKTVSELKKVIPRDLAAVINKCLEKDQEDRFNTMNNVLNVLKKMNNQSMINENDLKHSKSRSTLKWLIPATGIVSLLLILWISGIFQVKENKKELNSIAVLPLANLSGNPDKEYFSDGMTEALITELAKIRALNVISRTSVMCYKNTEKPLTQIGKELNVDAVVEGSAMLVGDRVRITTQLVETATDHHLWANDYERDLKDILSLQKEVARAIASEINITLTQDEQKRLHTARTVNPRAQELYFLGRYHVNKITIEGAQKSIKYFQQAIEIDDQYALAYTGMAEAYDNLVGLGEINWREGMKMVGKYAEKALAIDPTIGETFALLGDVKYLLEWDWDGAEMMFKEGVELSPGSNLTRAYYANFLADRGRFDEAIAQFQQALSSAPHQPLYHYNMGLLYFKAGRYEEAIPYFLNAVDMDSTLIVAEIYLTAAYFADGKAEKGRSQLQHLQRKINQNLPLPVQYRYFAQAVILKFTNDKTGARKLLKKLLREENIDAAGAYRNTRLILYIVLDDFDSAFKLIRQFIKARDQRILQLKSSYWLKELRTDPRYPEMVKKIGLGL